MKGCATAAGNAHPKADPPRIISYVTFTSGQEALDYFYKLTSNLRRNQDLNEVPPYSLQLHIRFKAMP